MTSFTRDHPVIPGDPDPAHSIELWATSFPVPRWVAEKTYRQCYHCQDPFKSNQQHNCRLCGEIFCSRCTGKYHLPDQYDLKGKIGLMRVCFGCVVTCNRLRQASHNLPLDRVNKTIDVPDWQADAAYVACNKCAKKERGPHNCRLCGLLYCDACASKINIDIPVTFNKKRKAPPHRVCDQCRYRVIAGARMRGPLDPPSPQLVPLSSPAAAAAAGGGSGGQSDSLLGGLRLPTTPRTPSLNPQHHGAAAGAAGGFRAAAGRSSVSRSRTRSFFSADTGSGTDSPRLPAPRGYAGGSTTAGTGAAGGSGEFSGFFGDEVVSPSALAGAGTGSAGGFATMPGTGPAPLSLAGLQRQATGAARVPTPAAAAAAEVQSPLDPTSQINRELAAVSLAGDGGDTGESDAPAVPAPPAADTVCVHIKRIGRSTPLAVVDLDPECTLDTLNAILLARCPELRFKVLQYIVRGEPVSKNFWDTMKVKYCRGEVHVTESGLNLMPRMIPAAAAAAGSPVGLAPGNGALKAPAAPAALAAPTLAPAAPAGAPAAPAAPPVTAAAAADVFAAGAAPPLSQAELEVNEDVENVDDAGGENAAADAGNAQPGAGRPQQQQGRNDSVTLVGAPKITATYATKPRAGLPELPPAPAPAPAGMSVAQRAAAFARGAPVPTESEQTGRR